LQLRLGRIPRGVIGPLGLAIEREQLARSLFAGGDLLRGRVGNLLDGDRVGEQEGQRIAGFSGGRKGRRQVLVQQVRRKFESLGGLFGAVVRLSVKYGALIRVIRLGILGFPGIEIR
jgi:hypothetical protein